MNTQHTDIDLYQLEKLLLGLALGTIKAYTDEEGTPYTPNTARRVLRLAVESAHGRMQLAHEKGREPGMTNIFTGERIPLRWERRPNGAYALLLWLATVTHAEIVTATSEAKLSETVMTMTVEVLRDLMRFIVTDPGTSIGKPFPYSKQEMRRAFEEWNATQEGEW